MLICFYTVTKQGHFSEYLMVYIAVNFQPNCFFAYTTPGNYAILTNILKTLI